MTLTPESMALTPESMTLTPESMTLTPESMAHFVANITRPQGQMPPQNRAATLQTIPEDCRYRCIWQGNAKRLRAVKCNLKNS
jgi:hypothetical protein